MPSRVALNRVAITIFAVVMMLVWRGVQNPHNMQRAQLQLRTNISAAGIRVDEQWNHSSAIPGSGRVLVLYHITAVGAWEDIVRDQVTKLIFSGLYTQVDYVHCTVEGVAHSATSEAELYLSGFGKNFRVVRLPAPPTLLLSIASVHSLTATDRVLLMSTHGDAASNASEAGDAAYLRRTLVEYKLIKEYRQCLHLLRQTDSVGAPSCPHVYGNGFCIIVTEGTIDLFRYP